VSEDQSIYVVLRLHNIAIIEEFGGFDEFENHHARGHRVYVNAQGNYAEYKSSGKLEIDGQPVNLNTIQVTSVCTEEDSHKNFSFLEYTSIHLTEDIFKKLVRQLQAAPRREVMLSFRARKELMGKRECFRLSLSHISLDQKIEAAPDPKDITADVLGALRRIEMRLLALVALVMIIAGAILCHAFLW
jgi:hypothetical protein